MTTKNETNGRAELFGIQAEDAPWREEITIYRHNGFDLILRPGGWDGPVPPEKTARYVFADADAD